MYFALGETRGAIEYAAQAVELQQQIGDRWGERMTHYNMATALVALVGLDKAEEQLRMVVALDEAIGHPDLESDRQALARVQALRRGSLNHGGTEGQ